MWKDFWALTLDSPDFVWIFIAALVVLGIQTAVKFITKLPVTGELLFRP